MTISHGAPDSNGGGIDNEGTLTVSNSTIADNSVGYKHIGGGIFNDSDATLTVSNCRPSPTARPTAAAVSTMKAS